MKKLISFMLAAILASSALPVSAEKKGISLYYDGAYHTYTGTLFDLIVNGEKLTVPLEPITFKNRSLVPIREVFEALGATVDYRGETKHAIVSGNGISVAVQIDNNIAEVNGKEVAIPDGVVPKLITKEGGETKTMVPVRFISEEIGLDVDFDADYGAILINGSIDKSEEEETEQITINPPKITKKNDTTTIIAITTDKPIPEKIKASVTSSGVLYFDIANAKYDGASKTEVNHAAVASVRYGLHEDYTRVAVDMTDFKNYTVVTSATKKQVTITINAKDGTATEPPAEEPADEPTTPPDNTSSEDETTPIPEEEEVKVTVDIDALKKYTASNGIKYVVIDAGHGGRDPGAIGTITEPAALSEEEKESEEIPEADSDDEEITEEDGESEIEAAAEPAAIVTKYNEKDITLAIAKKVQKELQAEGIKVIMTRSGDTYPSLTERALLANKNDAALFVSIHVNSANNAPKANGIEVFYNTRNNKDYYDLTSKELANSVLKELIKETGALNRGVKTDNHAVTRLSYMPAILVEVGFISNADEIQLLIDPEYQQKLADAISAGIIAQLDNVTVPERRDLAEQMVAAQIGEEKAKEYMNEVWKK